jgi:hypothetical protein
VALLIAFELLVVVGYLFGGVKTAGLFYLLCGLLGFGAGYWAMLITLGAELFGTNLRATAATTIPNMVRGMVIPMTGSYLALKSSVGVIGAGATVGAVCFALAFYCILTLPETHGKDLDFVEE